MGSGWCFSKGLEILNWIFVWVKLIEYFLIEGLKFGWFMYKRYLIVIFLFVYENGIFFYSFSINFCYNFYYVIK